MIVKQDDFQSVIVPNMRGGDGQVTINHVAQGENCVPNTTLTARVDIGIGDSVGYHVHENDSEIYIVIEGELEADDNHEKIYTLHAGDVMLTPKGKGHSLTNRSDKPAAIWAIVVSA